MQDTSQQDASAHVINQTSTAVAPIVVSVQPIAQPPVSKAGQSQRKASPAHPSHASVRSGVSGSLSLLKKLAGYMIVGAILGAVFTFCNLSMDYFTLIKNLWTSGWTADGTLLLLSFLVIGGILGMLFLPVFIVLDEDDAGKSAGSSTTAEQSPRRLLVAISQFLVSLLVGTVGVPFYVLYYIVNYQPTQFSTTSFEAALYANAVVAIVLGVLGGLGGSAVGIVLAIRTFRPQKTKRLNARVSR